MPTELLTAEPSTIAAPDFQRRVNELRQTDNLTSWFYLVREYAFLALVLGLTIWLCNQVLDGTMHWLWLVPTLLVANLCIGAGQHRLATLTHEAAHYILFRNRLLNDFVSEWFCMFPLFGTTHSYRVQHLGHHQYPNDPEKDPDWAQLRLSGHRFEFPMSRGRFLWECVFKQMLWPPALVRYVLVRAFFKVDRDDGTPYRMIRRASKWLLLVGAAYHIALIVLLAVAVIRDDTARLLGSAAGSLVAILTIYTWLPERWFADYFIKPDLAVRTTARMRFVFNSVVLMGLAALTLATGRPWWLYFFVLWMIPLGTSFAFFMVLRQLVQHGNADRSRFRNTRNFFVHRLISLSVFPIGNDYHLPHHLFPLVPHYNLRALHRLLLSREEYCEEAIEAHGYFFSPEHPPTHPTVVDLLTSEPEA
jgi:fatty acid desaturase